MEASRLKMIFTKEEIKRIKISYSGKTTIQITVDVHGMKCSQARRFINNIINIIRTTFYLIIIHGYSHGTAIKDMLANNFRNRHVTEQYVDPFNPGVTHIRIAT